MMLGMATLTMVRSSRIMKKPRQRTSRMIHGLRSVLTAAVMAMTNQSRKSGSDQLCQPVDLVEARHRRPENRLVGAQVGEALDRLFDDLGGAEESQSQLVAT